MDGLYYSGNPRKIDDIWGIPILGKPPYNEGFLKQGQAGIPQIILWFVAAGQPSAASSFWASGFKSTQIIKDGRSRVPVLHSTKFIRVEVKPIPEIVASCPDWVEIQRALVNALSGRLEMLRLPHGAEFPKPSVYMPYMPCIILGFVKRFCNKKLAMGYRWVRERFAMGDDHGVPAPSCGRLA